MIWIALDYGVMNEITMSNPVCGEGLYSNPALVKGNGVIIGGGMYYLGMRKGYIGFNTGTEAATFGFGVDLMYDSTKAYNATGEEVGETSAGVFNGKMLLSFRIAKIDVGIKVGGGGIWIGHDTAYYAGVDLGVYKKFGFGELAFGIREIGTPLKFEGGNSYIPNPAVGVGFRKAFGVAKGIPLKLIVGAGWDGAVYGGGGVGINLKGVELTLYSGWKDSVRMGAVVEWRGLCAGAVYNLTLGPVFMIQVRR